MSDLSPHNLDQPGPSLEETVALAKREGRVLGSAIEMSLADRWKDFQIAVGTWLLSLWRKYGGFLSSGIGFHSPAPQEETRYSDEFIAFSKTLAQMASAGKITIGAPQSEMEPYQAPAEYEEMLLTD